MKINSLVLCVNDSNYNTLKKEITPVKNEMYVIRDDNGAGGIQVEEIINKKHVYEDAQGKPFYGECYFKKERFIELQPPLELEEIMEVVMMETV